MKIAAHIFIVFISLKLIGCSKSPKPYSKFESELKEAICDCISLDANNYSKDQFMKEYDKCQNKTSSILNFGLDKFEEDPGLSKMDYISKMVSIVLELSDQCMRKYGKVNP